MFCLNSLKTLFYWRDPIISLKFKLILESKIKFHYLLVPERFLGEISICQKAYNWYFIFSPLCFTAAVPSATKFINDKVTLHPDRNCVTFVISAPHQMSNRIIIFNGLSLNSKKKGGEKKEEGLCFKDWLIERMVQVHFYPGCSII